jgi:hypothetical protein
MDFVRPLKAMRQIAIAMRNEKIPIVTGDFGIRGSSSRILRGNIKEPLVVVTLTINGTDAVPFTVTGVVAGTHVVCAGAPVHVTLTEPAKPPLGFT